MKTLDQYALNFFRVKPKMTVLEWAEKSVELSGRITEQPGPYSTRLHPYVREVLNCMSDPTIKKISLCWGSQTAKTTSFYVMLGWVVDQSPKPILWVFPNMLLCKAFSSERWLPFCRESKALVRHIPLFNDGTIDLDRFTLQKQEFSRCTMNLAGAGSSANVRSFPISVLVLDEIDVIDEGTRRECLDRIKGKTDYKILQSSTPINEQGGIWQEFLEGDRRRYFMPCPHCNERFFFRWKNDEGKRNIQFDEAAVLDDGTHNLTLVAKSSRYICEACGEPITDAQKSKMLRAGEWAPTSSSAEEGVRSYQLNSIYSPILTFGRIMVEYLKSKATVDGFRNFVNGWLAEPWRPDIGLVDPQQFRGIERDYQRGEIKGEYRILAVDVQRNHFVWVVRGFDADGQSYLIDNGNAPAFADFAALIDRYEIAYGVIDTGYRTQEIYEEIYTHRPFWFGAKGWDRMQTPFRMTKLDPFAVNQVAAKKVGKRHINLLHVNKQTWQEELLAKRNGAAGDWWVYSAIDAEYCRQMLATNLVEKVSKAGRVKREWVVEGHRQDHYWDCETYCLALARCFGLGGAIMRGAAPSKAHSTKPKKKGGKTPKPSPPSSFWD